MSREDTVSFTKSSLELDAFAEEPSIQVTAPNTPAAAVILLVPADAGDRRGCRRWSELLSLAERTKMPLEKDGVERVGAWIWAIVRGLIWEFRGVFSPPQEIEWERSGRRGGGEAST